MDSPVRLSSPYGDKNVQVEKPSSFHQGSECAMGREPADGEPAPVVRRDREASREDLRENGAFWQAQSRGVSGWRSAWEEQLPVVQAIVPRGRLLRRDLDRIGGDIDSQGSLQRSRVRARRRASTRLRTWAESRPAVCLQMRGISRSSLPTQSFISSFVGPINEPARASRNQRSTGKFR